MKLSTATSALLIGFSLFNAPAMAADDSGRVTFTGQIVDGDSPCLIGYADNDRAISLSATKTSAISLKVNRCGVETLHGITASFNSSNANTIAIKNSRGQLMNATPRNLALSQQRTLDFTASAASSGITQLTLAYQ
ncbi:hypothetical protein [Pantoea sp. SOD02]|uniref:hypothetical protein n=1 Tax=Pantoea sp. SOD02 TaxID=2970818 RepID=UPI002158A0A9|nr:hypothetical protein [Pantoea sp. SOD02]UVC29330.1 hypothetical protein NR302_19240 [Pantoea sp. SOD02]